MKNTNYFVIRKFRDGVNLWLSDFEHEIIWSRNSEEAYLGDEEEMNLINQKLGLYGKVEKV